MAAALIAVIFLVLAFRKSGEFLVVDNRQKSDAIVITQGDELDPAYWLGFQLLKQDYAGKLFIDARTNRLFFGRSQADLANQYIQQTAAALNGRVKVCPVTANTTAEEVYDVAKCLGRDSIHSVLLISDDYHTRRSLLIFSHLLPGYRWSVAAVRDPKEFGEQWWLRRAWIRTAVVQWQHLLWWELLDRWRFTPVQ